MAKRVKTRTLLPRGAAIYIHSSIICTEKYGLPGKKSGSVANWQFCHFDVLFPIYKFCNLVIIYHFLCILRETRLIKLVVLLNGPNAHVVVTHTFETWHNLLSFIVSAFTLRFQIGHPSICHSRYF